MKNKVLKLSVLTLLVLIVFSCNGVYAGTANNMDNSGPICTLGLNTRLGIGKTTYGYVSCYDDSDLGDATIRPSDFRIDSRLFGRAKILNVTPGYRSTFNSKYYRWDFQIKGVFFGEVNVGLNPAVISDVHGNSNYSSTTTVMRIGLF